MHLLFYLRLVLLAAGTLLPFFWMVVIVGHRRQRNFERFFFFLCLALTLFLGSSLLALNAELYYGTLPQGLLRIAWTFLCLSLWFIPPLVVHLHTEYASIRELIPSRGEKTVWLGLAWLPALLLSSRLFSALRLREAFAFESPSQQLGPPFQVWLIAALAIAAYWQGRFAKASPDKERRSFHRRLEANLGLLSVLLIVVFAARPFTGEEAAWALPWS